MNLAKSSLRVTKNDRFAGSFGHLTVIQTYILMFLQRECHVFVKGLCSWSIKGRKRRYQLEKRPSRFFRVIRGYLQRPSHGRPYWKHYWTSLRVYELDTRCRDRTKKGDRFQRILRSERKRNAALGSSPHKFIDRSCKTPQRAAWTDEDSVSGLFPVPKVNRK